MTAVAPKHPKLADLTSLSDPDKVRAIQQYIQEFEYNYSGKPFLKLKKNGGADHIKHSVLKLIEISLPIQCVEAVFIGGYLTAKIPSLERVPVSFKSSFRGVIYRHIILALRHSNRWGAIGLSRRENLMDKGFEFDSLSELIREYDVSYASCFHTLSAVYIGLPLPRHFESAISIKWKAVKILMVSRDYTVIARDVEAFCDIMGREKDEYYQCNS